MKKEYKYTINGHQYEVAIGDIEDTIATVVVNGEEYKVEWEPEAEPEKKKPVLGKPAAANDTTTPEESASGANVNTNNAIKAPLPGVITSIEVNVGDEVKAITLSAMRGEIDFKESFTRRVALLKGLDESVKQDIIDHLPITEGADRLFSVLKKCGFKIAILSGGFTFVGKYLQERFGVDYVYANTLEVENGKFTGRYIGDVVDAKRKAELLELIAQVEHIDLAQVIAVGDGANDLNMLGKAGLGIAFHAKPKVQASAQQAISTVGLDGILYFLGFRDVQLR